jgi:hypothetical protein
LTSDRRRVRVKVAYSLDNDRLSPITQTTVIKSEPCFKVTATEDEVTKHFYRNKSQTISREQKITQFVRQRMPSDADSLDDEYSPEMIVSHLNTNRNFFFIVYTFRKKEQQLPRSFKLLNILFLIEQILLHL